MLKSDLRKRALKLRRELTEENFRALNEQLLGQFKTLNFNEISVLHIFLPIEEQREPDTFLFVNWLKETHPHVKILVPRADFNSFLMTHHEYLGHEQLQKNFYNILEPQNADGYIGAIDLVIVPLLAVDQRGYRVGYGKGFYDRFLQSAAVGQTLGISFFAPVVEISDANAHDIRLNGCITPEGIIRF